MADIITCPSGLQGRVGGMKVREERVLADRKLAKFVDGNRFATTLPDVGKRVRWSRASIAGRRSRTLQHVDCRFHQNSNNCNC